MSKQIFAYVKPVSMKSEEFRKILQGVKYLGNEKKIGNKKYMPIVNRNAEDYYGYTYEEGKKVFKIYGFTTPNKNRQEKTFNTVLKSIPEELSRSRVEPLKVEREEIKSKAQKIKPISVPKSIKVEREEIKSKAQKIKRPRPKASKAEVKKTVGRKRADIITRSEENTIRKVSNIYKDGRLESKTISITYKTPKENVSASTFFDDL